MKAKDMIKNFVRGEIGKVPLLVLVGEEQFSTLDGLREYTKKQLESLPADNVVIINEEEAKL